jgi:hypothetical protein
MGRYSGDPRTAEEIIMHEKRASVRRRFPSEFLSRTYDEIAASAARGRRPAQTAKKLLDRSEYDKEVQ